MPAKTMPILIRDRNVDMDIGGVLIWVIGQSARQARDLKELIENEVSH